MNTATMDMPRPAADPCAHDPATLDLPACLARIGWTGAMPTTPDLATLSALQAAHAQAIAFENLDPWLGRPVVLDLPALQAKLVHGGRGGYCYEQNLLFGALLRRLGFAVTDLAARVRWNTPPGGERPRTHMFVRVDLPGADAPPDAHGTGRPDGKPTADGSAWLVDVGFGGHTLTAPLRLFDHAVQRAGTGLFRIAPGPQDAARRAWAARMPADQLDPEGSALQVHGRSGWQTLYVIGAEPQRLADFAMTSWYLCQHPASMFRQVLMAARPTPEGRWTLRDRSLVLHHADGHSETRELASAAEVREALTNVFGLRLEGIEGLDDGLDRLMARPG